MSTDRWGQNNSKDSKKIANWEITLKIKSVRFNRVNSKSGLPVWYHKQKNYATSCKTIKTERNKSDWKTKR